MGDEASLLVFVLFLAFIGFFPIFQLTVNREGEGGWERIWAKKFR